MAFRLSDEDRERFGCAEWLDFDPWAISIADMDELSERFGFDPEDWPEPFRGEITLEQAGNPDAKRKKPRWQTQAAVWMALHQAGHDTSWDDAGRVQLFKIGVREEPGKDPADGEASPSSDASTIPPSDTSSLD